MWHITNHHTDISLLLFKHTPFITSLQINADSGKQMGRLLKFSAYSILLYLNDDFEGGNTTFFPEDPNNTSVRSRRGNTRLVDAVHPSSGHSSNSSHGPEVKEVKEVISVKNFKIDNTPSQLHKLKANNKNERAVGVGGEEKCQREERRRRDEETRDEDAREAEEEAIAEGEDDEWWSALKEERQWDEEKRVLKKIKKMKEKEEKEEKKVRPPIGPIGITTPPELSVSVVPMMGDCLLFPHGRHRYV